MKPNFNRSDAPKNDALLSKLNRILTSLDIDNFTFRLISGTTDAVANTPTLFRHNMIPRPWVCIPYQGDVYFGPIDNTNIDVRSTQVSMPFQVYVLG